METRKQTRTREREIEVTCNAIDAGVLHRQITEDDRYEETDVDIDANWEQEFREWFGRDPITEIRGGVGGEVRQPFQPLQKQPPHEWAKPNFEGTP